jgi:hypothetical protein
MIEGKVRHALGLLADTQNSWGYPHVAPEMLDEMATFCSSFPAGTADDFWRWHLDNIALKYGNTDRAHASP